MQDYTEPSLNNRIREKAIRNESLDRNTEKNVKRSADVSGSGTSQCEVPCFCLFEFNYTGCEQSRSEMERWKILHSAKNLKQNKKDSERVVCTFGETHAISAIASSTTRIRGRTLRTETLDQNNVRDCLQSCGYSGKWTSVL